MNGTRVSRLLMAAVVTAMVVAPSVTAAESPATDVERTCEDPYEDCVKPLFQELCDSEKPGDKDCVEHAVWRAKLLLEEYVWETYGNICEEQPVPCL